jgi:hypothetical protein
VRSAAVRWTVAIACLLGLSYGQSAPPHAAVSGQMTAASGTVPSIVGAAPAGAPTVTVEPDHFYVDATLPGIATFMFVVKAAGMSDAYFPDQPPRFLADPFSTGAARSASAPAPPGRPRTHGPRRSSSTSRRPGPRSRSRPTASTWMPRCRAPPPTSSCSRPPA